MTHPDLHTLTGAYALDALDPDERAAFDAHLGDCGACRKEVDGFLATAAMLGSAEAATPPAHLKGAVLDRVATTPQDPPRTSPPARPRPDAVVDAAAVLTADDLQTWDAELAAGGSARVVYSARRGEGWFLADGMDATAPGMVYALWLVDAHGPSPAGRFSASDGRAAHAFTGDMSDVLAISVTVEPVRGSRQPTTDPVVVLET